MATTSSVTDTSAAAVAALNAASAGSAVKKDDGSERFLRLLVSQMQNQDPLNPMDNAQVTSQIAQINTVTGIEKLNTTVTGLSSQMLQSQALQGASLVGRSVLMEGNQLRFGADGAAATGGFDLAGAADHVSIEILSPSGRVLDTLDVGAASGGRNGFEWQAPAGSSTDGITFRVTAKAGGAAVGTTPLSTDLVKAVSTTGDALTLQLLHGGNVPYTQIKAFS